MSALTKEDIKWLTGRFNVTEAEIVGHNSGICYSKLWVKTEEAAKRAAATVEGQTVNGGWFDGMALGGIVHYDGTEIGKPIDEGVWEVLI